MAVNFKRALLVVDVQNDFCPGGKLAVKDGDKIIPAINKYIKFFSENKLPVLASRDWHPKNTKHFKEFGGTWPAHCIQNSKGAQFHPQLKLTQDAIILSKGMDPEKDSYSAFQAQDSNGTGLNNWLKILGVKELYICGLATDYCVKYSTLDALKLGLKVFVLKDAIKGVNVNPDDSKLALNEMVKTGAKLEKMIDVEMVDVGGRPNQF